MVKIILVEDHPLMGPTVARFLQRDGRVKVLDIVTSAEAALDWLAAEPAEMPDIIVIDVSLPAMNGLDLAELLQQKYPDLPSLMLSGHREAHYVQRALAAGARGYVTKDDPLAIADALDEIMAGGTYLSETLRD